jgi:hypothetical protein
VLAVPVNQRVIAQGPGLGREARADELIASLSGRAWRTRSAGAGAKGDRRYAWARARINGGNDPEAERWLLARRSLANPEDTAYWICHGPERVGLAEFVRVAGARWAIEESFQTAEGETGLDHYQVRQWTGWYRHITLATLAHAFLTVTRSKKGLTSTKRRTDSPDPARNQARAHPPHLGTATRPGAHPPALPLAPTTPTNRPTTALPGPRIHTINATVVLEAMATARAFATRNEVRIGRLHGIWKAVEVADRQNGGTRGAEAAVRACRDAGFEDAAEPDTFRASSAAPCPRA